MAKVTLIAHTPDPEKLVAASAKLCYSPATIEDLMDGLDEEKTTGFLQMLSDFGHQSPIEHISFTFGIEEVSRTLLAQITRHRIASFSVQSQRYVKEKQFSFVTPPQIAADPQASELYQQAMRSAHEQYLQLTDILQKKNFEQLIAEGVDEKRARSMAEKRAIEDARFVLPNACDTKMILTMNARSLLNFFQLRCCNRAQWEIRDVATQMLHLVQPIAPTIFAKAGPGCLRGPCPEGKMTCGKMEQVRAEFLKKNSRC
ncbi:FAD-dependent thymidylate synthase [uncultured Negativibacillus sp.]|uniref:FAD-dependent thymidylate synthase n=1 Tax=uncultured Negativibacillus sp. TaxID=1980696 RepID=UPI0025EDF438|nr:FAD-dependent thymidylate synthase [uncultured Negativibacillus sp.]